MKSTAQNRRGSYSALFTVLFIMFFVSGLTVSDALASTESGFAASGSSISAPASNTFAGAASFSFPIAVPPGRLGLAPNISLNYNSLGGNGWVGVGWDFDMGSIQRNTKFGLDYAKNDFVFSKGGSSSELVNISGNEYRAKIEDGSFIRFFYNQATSSWTAYDKNGTVYFYGSTNASRQDFSSGANIFKWSLDNVQDSNGNYMIVSYWKDQGEIYLLQIGYTGNINGLSPSNQIKFLFESRTDAPVMYNLHSSVRTAYRLKTIEVYGSGQLSSKYVLSYTYSNSTSRSILASFTPNGSDGITALSDITISYNIPQNSFSNQGAWIAGAYANWASSTDRIRNADVNGEYNQKECK